MSLWDSTETMYWVESYGIFCIQALFTPQHANNFKCPVEWVKCLEKIETPTSIATSQKGLWAGRREI